MIVELFMHAATQKLFNSEFTMKSNIGRITSLHPQAIFDIFYEGKGHDKCAVVC